MNAALDQLATERSDATSAGRFATALTFAFTENWPGLVPWCRRDISVTAEPAVRTLYLRALGETGALDDLVWQFAARTQSPESRLTNSPQFALDLACLLAFCGRTGELVRLLERDLAKLARDHQQFWIATAELAEGQTSRAIHRLEKLRGETRDATLQRAIERRLAHAQNFSTARLSSSSQALLTRLTAETVGPPKSPASRSTRGAPAVWTLIVLNLAMFAVELILGGSTNGQTLHNLGALEPDSVIVRHEYWRLLTALFLHYGLLHILFNLYALYLLGPALERIIGSAKFALSYLIAGLGSSAGVVWLRVLGLTNADQLVGASGCVMGVIGVSAGLLLRHRQSPLAGRRLRNIIVIVALQTAFDLSTPQVSLAAHLSGFITGVGVGTILASTRRRLTILERSVGAPGSPDRFTKGNACCYSFSCQTFRPCSLAMLFRMPNIHTYNVIPNLPAELEPLREMVFNLWWTWEPSARRLFRHLDPELWNRTNHNPVRMLQLSRQARLVEVAQDKSFLRDLAEVHQERSKNISRARTPTGKKARAARSRNRLLIFRRSSAFTSRFRITPAVSAFSPAIIANRRAIWI